MRTLWLVRDNLTQHLGGDTVQILQTAQALQAMGVEVDVRAMPCDDFRGYDVVHLFHLDRLWENIDHCRRIRAAGIPAVLSTIYWPSDDFDHAGRTGLQGALSRFMGSHAYRTLRVMQRASLAIIEQRYWRCLDPRLLSFHLGARYVLECVSVLLPNSQAELHAIERQFGVKCNAVIVPNAVDGAVFGPPESDAAKSRSGVLCVGRIEARKNQLGLLRALAGTDVPVRLVGQPGRYSRQYYEQCRAAAGRNVTFLGYRVAAGLRELYHQAQVHACVSWYETPGLVSLEAALCGCSAVITPEGSTREYFQDDAYYCSPNDCDSIRTAVLQAIDRGPRPGLAERIRREFTWEMAARRTLEAYELALSAPLPVAPAIAAG